ncbi:signal peptide-containing protein [Cryptosporidium parvum]
MNGSKNRPSFSVKILLFFLTSGYLIFSPVVFGIGLSQEQTGFTGYDSPIQETSGLEATNYEARDYSTIFGQDASSSPESKTLGELSRVKSRSADRSPSLPYSQEPSMELENSISKSPSAFPNQSQQYSPVYEQSPSKNSRFVLKRENSLLGELSKSKSSSKSKSPQKKIPSKDKKRPLVVSLSSEASHSERSKSRSPSRSSSKSRSKSRSRSELSKSRTGYGGEMSISSPEISPVKTEKSRSKSRKESSKRPSTPESEFLKEQEVSSSQNMGNIIPLTAPDMSPSPKFSFNEVSPSNRVEASNIEASASPSTLLDQSIPQEASVSSPESSSLLSEELSVKEDGSLNATQMPSRKSSGTSESVSARPYTPVDEGSEFSTLLDGSLSSNEPIDTSHLPLEVASESSIGSNYMTLLSSLYGMQALSGVPLDFSEELFRIEILVSEALYNTGLSISNADVTLLTKRVALVDSSDKNNSFGAQVHPNSFEKIPSFPKVTFNFAECVYQLENILFHTRSFIKPVSMSHILKGCDHIRSSLNISKPIMENNEIFTKVIQYLILRIYNIGNHEILSIIHKRTSIPAILDLTVFEKLQKSLIEDFLSDSTSLPLPVEFWRTIFVQQLHSFNLYSKDLIGGLLDDHFGLMDILLDTMYSDPIKMCPYITSIVFYKVNPFKIEDIRINSAKIQTFCLIYLKNMGLNELVTLNKLNMPTLSRNSRLDQIAKQLAPGFEILPYFHPDFPKDGNDLTWETCYSIYSSVSMMLNSLQLDLIFPQISPLCTKITKKPPSPKFILGMFSRILDIPSTIQNSLLEIQDIDQIISSLSVQLKLPETHLREIYTDYIQGNPIKYLNTIYTILTKSLKFYFGFDSNQESNRQRNSNKTFEQLFLTRNISENTQMFERLNYWSTIHLYFLSFTMGIPNSSEILSGIYSFTPSNCESLLFSFFRRVSYSTRSSIADSLTLCITMYSVIYKNNISSVLVKNISIKELRDALNYKIGTWTPTQNEWMRSIYMVFENKLEIIPNISNIQTLSLTINEDFFNCFYSVNKYLHGMVTVTRFKDIKTPNLENRILNERSLGFNLCSSMSIGAHSTREEAIELRIISTVIEAVRQFGFKIDIEYIKEFINNYKLSNNSAFPSGRIILDNIISKFPNTLGTAIKKAFQANSSSSNSLPYFIQAERIISKTLESRGCFIQNKETSIDGRSFELSRDISISPGNKNVSYYNTINSCLSWKTFGYFNLISCYSVLVNSGTCESKDVILEAMVEIAERLEWPRELILLILSQDFSLSDSNVFQKIKQSTDQEEFEKYLQIIQDLIVHVEEHVNDFSWSEKSLSNPKDESYVLAEPSEVSISKSQTQKINYSFAFGFSKDSIGDYLRLWEYRKEIVLNQIMSFPVNPSLSLTKDEISSLLMDSSPQNINKFVNSKMTPFANKIKELCYKEPHGSFLCEIKTQIGLPPLKIYGKGSNMISTSISVMNPPKELGQENLLVLMIATPSKSSIKWEKLEPQSLLFLSVLMGPKWEKELKRYTQLSVKYFPYSGEYIRLTPPVFKIETKESIIQETSDLLDSSISASISRSPSTKMSKASVLPGVWHEHLGNISIQKLVDFSKFVPDNSNLLINIVWTLASAFNSLWVGGVELCQIDLKSIYAYLGSQNQQSLNMGKILDEFLEFGPNEENVHSLTNFVLHTLSPPLIRFSELGRSRVHSVTESSIEASQSKINECNDQLEVMNIFKNILSSTDLSGKIKGQNLETICREISEIDPTKLDCSSLAWARENSRIPNDLDKWPITDIPIVSPTLKQQEVEIPTSVNPNEEFSNLESKYSEQSRSLLESAPTIPVYIPPSAPSIPPSIPPPIRQSVRHPIPPSISASEPSAKEVVTEESQKKEFSPESPPSEESEVEGTSTNEIFDQASVDQGDSSVFVTNPILPPPPTSTIVKPYKPEDLNEFTLVKVPKGQLMNLHIYPRITGNLSEQRKFEIKELLTTLKGVAEELISKFTSWSASISRKHSSIVPDVNFKPSFIFVPPTPNNRADSPRILEKEFYIHESVFLFAREELQRIELPMQQIRNEDLVEVKMSRASLAFINNNKQAPPSITIPQAPSFPDIRPNISPISQAPSSIGGFNDNEISHLVSNIEKKPGKYKESIENTQRSSELSNSLEKKSDISLSSGSLGQGSESSQREMSSESVIKENSEENVSESQRSISPKSNLESENIQGLSNGHEYGYSTDSSITKGEKNNSNSLAQENSPNSDSNSHNSQPEMSSLKSESSLDFGSNTDLSSSDSKSVSGSNSGE